MVVNYVGEEDSVRDRQKEYISEVLEKRSFQDCDVLIEPVGKAGDNYIANVKRIIVNQNGETLKMIAKLAPDNSMMRQMANIGGLFQNEHVIYTELFSKFKEIQINAEIPEKVWFRHAECYGTFNEAPNEVILLEDLKESKYDILDRFKPMTNECVQLVLKNFAVFHSLSYVLKYQEPETFAAIKSKLINVYDQIPELMEPRKQWATQMEESAIVLLDDEQYRSALRGSISNIYELSSELEELESYSKCLVIQQGDGWTNNIMFVLNNDQPLQCVLIDYQMAKASNPMYDIMYMIFNSTETEQRIEHFSEYIDYYYNELDKSLSNYGLKASEAYPRDQMNTDMTRSAKLVLAVSILVTNIVTKDVEEASKLQETMKSFTEVTDENIAMMMDQTTETKALFKQKLHGLVRSFVDLELL